MPPVELINLRNENKRLKSLNEIYKRRLEAQNTRIETLLEALRVFNATTGSAEQDTTLLESYSEDVEMTQVSEVSQNGLDGLFGEELDDGNGSRNPDSLDSEERSNEDSDQALWDEIDSVFRCPHCSGEVLDGYCQLCCAEIEWPESYSDEKQAAFTFAQGSTENAAESDDRSPVPRGDTPLLDNLSIKGILPQGYYDRGEEYLQLRRRGATRHMCTTFQLSFQWVRGIEAILPLDVKEIFAGPDMRVGVEVGENSAANDDNIIWYLALGRRVQLEDEDEDGKEFIIGLLEDALFFSQSCFAKAPRKWETVRDPGRDIPGSHRKVWVTRPKAESWGEDPSFLDDDYIANDNANANERYPPDAAPWEIYDRLLEEPFVEYGPTLHRDEYEIFSDEEEGEEEDDDDDEEDHKEEIFPPGDVDVDDESETDGFEEEDGVFELDDDELDRDSDDIPGSDWDSDS